jgi:hypothetical protein
MAQFKSRWTCYTVRFLDDGDNVVETVAVNTRDADIIATERQMGAGINKLDAEGKAELAPRIAWNGLRRMGRQVGEFDDFINRVDVTRVVEEAEADPNPSGAAPSVSESPSPD